MARSSYARAQRALVCLASEVTGDAAPAFTPARDRPVQRQRAETYVR